MSSSLASPAKEPFSGTATSTLTGWLYCNVSYFRYESPVTHPLPCPIPKTRGYSPDMPSAQAHVEIMIPCPHSQHKRPASKEGRSRSRLPPACDNTKLTQRILSHYHPNNMIKTDHAQRYPQQYENRKEKKKQIASNNERAPTEAEIDSQLKQ